MSDPSASFVVALKDETSGPAGNAAAALERLQSRLDADTKALRNMETAMRRLKAGGQGASATAQTLTDRITAQKAAIAQAQAKVIELGGSLDTTKRKSTSFGAALSSVLATGLQLPGPIVAVASAVFALTVAMGAAVAMLVRYGIAQADVRRNELLRLEGLSRLRSAYGGATASATEMQAAIDRTAAGSALGRDQVASLATGLRHARLSGAALTQTLEALAIVESAAGDEGLRRMRGRLIAEGRAGRSAAALAGMQRRFGDIARRQALSLDVQQRKLGESFNALFSGLVIERFLEGLHEVTDLFSQNTVTGRALKTVITTLLQPMIDGITTLAPLARRFFQGMVIAVQELTIKFLELRLWMRETFGGTDILGNVDGMTIALYAGMAAVGLLVVGVVALGAAVGLVVGLIASWIVVLGTVPALIGAAVYAIGSAVVAIGEWFSSGAGERFARSLIDGLVNGISEGAARVTQQVRILAADVTATIEGAFDSHSPSRVFAEIGDSLPEGLAVGVERSAPVASRAVDDMAAAAIPSGAGAGGQTAISIGDVNVVASNGDPSSIANEIVEALVSALQGSVLARGAPA